MKKNVITVLLLIPVLFSCMQNRRDESRFTTGQIKSLYLNETEILSVKIDSVLKVDLNPFLKNKKFDFDSYLEDRKLIPLETTDESLIANIYNILVTDSNIYVHDNYKGGSVIIFDRTGKYLKRILSGQGPGEILFLNNIAFDVEENELIVFNKIFLSFFDSNGKFLRKIPLPFGVVNFAVIPDGYVFKALKNQGNNHLGFSDEFSLFITDKDLKLKSVGMPYDLSKTVEFSSSHGFLYKNDKNINITHMLTDTIYQYTWETNQLQAKYVLNYDTKKLPERYLKSAFKDYENALVQNDYYSYLGDYSETDTHEAFSLLNWHNSSVTVYRDKKSGNLSGGSNVGFPLSSNGDYFIYYFLPGHIDISNSYIAEEDKQKIKDLKDDDNPIVELCKLKNF